MTNFATCGSTTFFYVIKSLLLFPLRSVEYALFFSVCAIEVFSIDRLVCNTRGLYDEMRPCNQTVLSDPAFRKTRRSQLSLC